MKLQVKAMQAYRLWAAVLTHYFQLVYICHLRAANRNLRYIGGVLKTSLN